MLDQDIASPTVAHGAVSLRGDRQAIHWNDLAIRLSLLFVLLVLFGIFSLLRPDHFPTVTNMSAIVSQQGIAVLAAIALTIALTTNEFDLSIGGIIGIVAIIGAWGFGQGWSMPAVVAAGLGLSLLIGVLNAFLVVTIGLSSFIATLGVNMLLSGLALMVTGGSPLYRGIPVAFQAITSTRLLGLPSLAWIIIAIALLVAYFLGATPTGRMMRATGAGREASKLIGIRTNRYVALSLLFTAFICGIAGILFIANNGAVSTNAGQNYTLSAYAAAFLGATSMRPVRFNIFGSVISVLILSIGSSGLTMMGAPVWVPQVFNALALLFALIFSRWLSVGIARRRPARTKLVGKPAQS